MRALEDFRSPEVPCGVGPLELASLKNANSTSREFNGIQALRMKHKQEPMLLNSYSTRHCLKYFVLFNLHNNPDMSIVKEPAQKGDWLVSSGAIRSQILTIWPQSLGW